MSPQPISNSLLLDSRLEEIARAEAVVLQDMTPFDYTESHQFGIKLALEEALANAIKHGNNLSPNKQVTLSYEITSETITLTVCDQGKGFSPDQIPDCTTEENLDRPSGRGVMLMRAYMSHIEYNDTGNCITMVMQKNGPPEED